MRDVKRYTLIIEFFSCDVLFKKNNMLFFGNVFLVKNVKPNQKPGKRMLPRSSINPLLPETEPKWYQPSGGEFLWGLPN